MVNGVINDIDNLYKYQDSLKNTTNKTKVKNVKNELQRLTG